MPNYLANGVLLVLAAAVAAPLGGRIDLSLPKPETPPFEVKEQLVVMPDGSGKMTVTLVLLTQEPIPTEELAEWAESLETQDYPPSSWRNLFKGATVFSPLRVRVIADRCASVSYTVYFQDVNAFRFPGAPLHFSTPFGSEGPIDPSYRTTLKILDLWPCWTTFRYAHLGDGFALEVHDVEPLVEGSNNVEPLFEALIPTGWAGAEWSLMCRYPGFLDSDWDVWTGPWKADHWKDVAAAPIEGEDPDGSKAARKAFAERVLQGRRFEQTFSMPGDITEASAWTAHEGRTASFVVTSKEIEGRILRLKQELGGQEEDAQGKVLQKLAAEILEEHSVRRIECGPSSVSEETIAAFRQEFQQAKSAWDLNEAKGLLGEAKTLVAGVARLVAEVERILGQGKIPRTPPAGAKKHLRDAEGLLKRVAAKDPEGELDEDVENLLNEVEPLRAEIDKLIEEVEERVAWVSVFGKPQYEGLPLSGRAMVVPIQQEEALVVMPDGSGKMTWSTLGWALEHPASFSSFSSAPVVGPPHAPWVGGEKLDVRGASACLTRYEVIVDGSEVRQWFGAYHPVVRITSTAYFDDTGKLQFAAPAPGAINPTWTTFRWETRAEGFALEVDDSAVPARCQLLANQTVGFNPDAVRKFKALVETPEEVDAPEHVKRWIKKLQERHGEALRQILFERPFSRSYTLPGEIKKAEGSSSCQGRSAHFVLGWQELGLLRKKRRQATDGNSASDPVEASRARRILCGASSVPEEVVAAFKQESEAAKAAYEAANKPRLDAERALRRYPNARLPGQWRAALKLCAATRWLDPDVGEINAERARALLQEIVDGHPDTYAAPVARDVLPLVEAGELEEAKRRLQQFLAGYPDVWAR